MREATATTCHTMPLPPGAGPARLIVCESSGDWSRALQRELAGSNVRVSQFRSIVDGWEQLARSPASFLVVELARTNLASVLERVAWWDRDFPLARWAAVAPRSWQSCQWYLREAGAVALVTSPRQAPELARMAQRHLDAAPRPVRSITEEIWASLPWGKPEPTKRD